ncbi:50S ribosomal protein L15 [Pseudaquidulcibacter saccharophilus]|uniref:50S ribosomal protein L15 n=1 Tax=Pseudaquidulcibacter saccharophilus TaxID=2831900 RepID=UPI001EFF3CCF|nr:50S ribosomal protein L15 [Pseudaquidulcibacter saccharophilus]
MNLNELNDNEGAVKARMRVGRGVGSGKGKTCGRGVKGQKSRRGVSINGFEGGQMPIHMRIPKRGFNKLNAKTYNWVNLSDIEKAVKAGKLDVKAEITEETLVATGVVRRAKDGIRLLGKGELTAKVNLVLSGATQTAIAAVEKAGGSVTVTKAAKTEEA